MAEKERKPRPRGQVVPREPGERRKCRTWLVRVPLKERGMSGRHQTHAEIVRGTELQAIKRRDALLAQVEAGQFHRPAPVTITALCVEWLAQKKREGKRPKSLDAYDDTVRYYIEPRLGRLLLRELTPLAVRNWLNSLQDRKLSTTTIRYARSILNMILREAVAWGYLKENPAQNIKVPKGTEGRALYCLTLEESCALVTAALSDPDDLVFIFALLTGLRPEEYLGIRREDIGFEGGRGVARVRQVAVRLRKGGWEFLPPKTAKGVRDVPFPAWLHAELLRHETLVESRRLAMGQAWSDSDLVFPSSDGAPQAADRLLSGRFRRLLKRAGLGAHFTLYSLRYTFATLQYLAGERDRVISDLMGHERVDFSKEVYVRVLPRMREAASDSLERLLSEGLRTTLAQQASELSM